MKFYTLIALCTLMLMGACKKSDDIGKLFEGKTWYFANGRIQGRPISGNDLKKFYQNNDTYRIVFGTENLSGTLATGNTFIGTWKADGKKQTIEFRLSEPAGTLSEMDRAIFNTLRKTVRYEGDENQMTLKADDQNYISCSSTRTKESAY
ncbi:MAG: DUF4847 family protein [Bacteroidaceae bacterium]|nr:DUF4847 family protein [Bacteroidaceae bacterium]MBP5523953.1 DUF4847 family protein [Bacteroidaceae bacterium]